MVVNDEIYILESIINHKNLIVQYTSYGVILFLY